jgi:hypothetical protein
MAKTKTTAKAAAPGAQQVQVQSIFSPGSAAAAQQLVTGLGGAIGSDYRAAGHQLVFVEFDGKLSRLNLSRAPSPSPAPGPSTSTTAAWARPGPRCGGSR